MLLSFRVSNFRSIRDEQEFSLVNDGRNDTPGSEGWDDGVGTVAGIFGANASGKSNLVNALWFMRTAVMSSYESWASKGSIPVTPFALDPSLDAVPSLFESVFQIGKVRYQYGFLLNKEKVVSEWLYAYVTHRRQVWFERDTNSKDEWYFGKSFTGRNRVIADLTGPATLFLSAAAANNHKAARSVEHFFRVHMTSAFPHDIIPRTEYTRVLSEDEHLWKSVVDLMRFADLGISSARVQRRPWRTEDRKVLTDIFRAVEKDAPEEEIKNLVDRAGDTVEFGHITDTEHAPAYLPFETESLGTRTLFALAGPVIRAISNGDTLMVDEIDASLHPRLTCELIRIFKDPAENPKQAQLIFTSHDTTLLGGLLDQACLARDEVWFTEKKPNGTTTLYPLTDFSPRKNENFERGYLQGRYGAIPYFDRNFTVNSSNREIEQPGTSPVDASTATAPSTSDEN